MAKRKKKRLPNVMEYDPPYENFDGGTMQMPDDQPGMPALQSVGKAAKSGRGRLYGQIHEEPMKSTSLLNKINNSLGGLAKHPKFSDQTSAVLDEMMHLSTNGFQCLREFQDYIAEGAIININRLASSYIGLPVGEYVVWNVGPSEAALVPVSSVDDVFSESPKPIEIHLSNLLGIWDKTERTISEKGDDPYMGSGTKTRLQKSSSKFARDQKVVSALEAGTEEQEDIAANLGVDPSTISRWKNKGNTGGAREPTLKNALKFAKSVGSSADELWGGSDTGVTKRRRKTSGSGGGRNPTYRQGSPSESKEYTSQDITEPEDDSEDEFIEQEGMSAPAQSGNSATT